jgi:hypothetical protein
MDSPAGALTNLNQCLKKTNPIRIIFKDVFTPISPTHHMVNGPLKLYSHLSRHLRSLPPAASKCKKKGLTRMALR